jgi:antitoxin CptB
MGREGRNADAKTEDALVTHAATPEVKDARDVRLRRIRYRSWHRGCKETDVILGNFADKALRSLTTDEELALYEALLEEQDVDIWNWLTDKTPLAAGRYDVLKRRLQSFALVA